MNETLRQAVLDLMNRHGIGVLEYEGPDGSLMLDAEQNIQDHPEVLATTPGIFLWKHPTDRTYPIWPRHVRTRDVIGWLRIGPILRPVLASHDAILRTPRRPDGSLAGYGERLF
jgi:hypothetical protein